ncbi:Nephrocystin-3 [Stylophora pistillata]|uniref:Nephrocystin-3 n=1 Tax=Stylophora pistillata TaxID=50429 RepID=A0A2B4RA16_STYPI|nr:Nephrocystin-3 [Stylophora pistillata]
MSLQPFSDKQLNYFKFASIVLNEFANALRQTFKSMWDNTFGHRPGYQLWDDSTAVRNLFLAEEGGKSKVPTHLSYEEWDCTALFQTTVYAKSFAMLDRTGHKKTLGELYLRHRKIPHGKFHVSVVSASGNQAETFTLAIDQLRLLRNSLCHSKKSEIDKPTFDQYMQLVKEAFKALGVKTDPIDAIAGLTESDFPTKEVRNLEQGINQELRVLNDFLKGESINELIAMKEKVDGRASKEDIALLERKIDDLKLEITQDHKGSTALLPPSCLPPMVPHFAGRQRECEEIIDLLGLTSTRIVSIWGSPGFGKTSVATAVGHKLQAKESTVYFLSLRGLNSKSDLISKLFSFFRRASRKDEIPQQLPIDEDLFKLLTEIPHKFLMILDNADDLLESGAPNVKENFIQFLQDMLSRSKKATFVITTRESLEFMNVHFEGHHAVRIGPLDESFSQALVSELLSNAITTSDCEDIAKICGHVPLAIKLLCSTISEVNTQPSQFLEEWKESVERNIVDLLDNPDYPSNLRLKFLFKSSFVRLSAQEKEALVSLSILSEDFNLSVAAAVMGVKTNFEAKKILHRLRRKSLLDSGSKPDSFLMHKLLLSFVGERGDDVMKETMLNSKVRLSAFYVSLFERLNEQFLTGHSMSAFVEFYEEKQNIIQSLTESSSDPKTCDAVFGVLIKAEIFLDSLFWCEGKVFDKIYESAIDVAKKLGKGVFYKQLLISLAFNEMCWGTEGRTMKLLSEVGDEQMSCSSLSGEHKGKLICYRGICQVASGKTDDGIRSLEEALSLMSGNVEQRILRVTAFQVLAICHRFKKQCSVASQFYKEALQECGAFLDTSLLIIPPMENKEVNNVEEEIQQRKPATHITHPLRLEIICVVGKATNRFSDKYTENSMTDAVIQIATELQKPIFLRSLGLWKFQRNVRSTLESVFNNPKEATKLSAASISYHEMAITEYKNMVLETHPKLDESLRLHLHQEELLKSYLDHGDYLYIMKKYSEAQRFYNHALKMQVKLLGEEHLDTAQGYDSLGATQHKLGDFASALQSKQRGLDIRVKLFGDEHPDTATSYESLGVTQHELGDSVSACQSAKRVLNIRVKLFGEEHTDTARSYESLSVTQHKLGDYASACQSAKCALDIRVKLFGKEHQDTMRSYHLLGILQHNLGDFASALLTKQHALDICVKLFGEEHPDTARSYELIGATQSNLGDFNSAVQSAKHALDIRVNLFGEEHADTARSYESLGVTQHELGDFASALQSKQHALDIRVKLFGKEHPDTARCYHLLGVTQHSLSLFASALQSKQHAVNIHVKLLGEEHKDTAQSYESLGITQHTFGDFASALQSTQHALNIRVKLFGEEHADTARSYESLGVTQHELGDFTSALQSKQNALNIRLKVFGEEHADTARSYESFGATQSNLGDFASALQSKQHALDIRVKLFGEQHADTAQSYESLGVTQHNFGDFASALQSAKLALDIRVKLFGEENADTARSYESLGATQSNLGDFASALQSKQHALDIHVKLFGEEHADTARSYESLGVTQHNFGDFASALQSKQHALDIRVKLFGEEHTDTARSYHLLGVTQHDLGDFASALQSAKRARDICVKLLAEEHAATPQRYESLGITLQNLGDFAAALQSAKDALDIRIKLFGEEHPDTARSYHILGITQHKLGHFALALHSKQHALDIRVKLFGEQHPDTAQSYESLGETQHNLGDFASALCSKQHALDIRVKLFGGEHPGTARSYESLGVTLHGLGHFASALKSKKHALDIRIRLFGEEHPDTARNFESLGVTQHELGDFASALKSKEHALDIRIRLFGEEHVDTARSYESLGVTQLNLGDFVSAFQSKQHALDIYVQLFGEEHADTARSYELLEATQQNLGDFASAFQSKKHAPDIRAKVFHYQRPRKICTGGSKMADRVSRKRKQIDYKALHESSTADIYQEIEYLIKWKGRPMSSCTW